MNSIPGSDSQETNMSPEQHLSEHGEDNIQIPNGVVDKFSAFVCSVCSLLIEADVYELQKLLTDNDHHSLVHSFLTKSSLPIFFVQKFETSSVVYDDTVGIQPTNDNPSGMYENINHRDYYMPAHH